MFLITIWQFKTIIIEIYDQMLFLCQNLKMYFFIAVYSS